MNDFTKPQPGQPFEPSSALQSIVIDMVAAHLARTKDQSIKAGDRPDVTVRNATEDGLPPFSIVGLGDIVIDPEVNLASFKLDRVFDTADPIKGKPFGVTQDPAPPSGLAEVRLAGVTICKVDFSDDTHRYADQAAATYGNLVSQAVAGPAKVLWKQDGTGVLWALVNLNPDFTGAAHTDASFHIPVVTSDPFLSNDSSGPSDSDVQVTVAGGIAEWMVSGQTVEINDDVTDDIGDMKHQIYGVIDYIIDANRFSFILRRNALPPSAWDATASYVVGDEIVWGGDPGVGPGSISTLYTCKLDHTNHVPTNTTYWSVGSIMPAGSNICPSGDPYPQSESAVEAVYVIGEIMGYNGAIHYFVGWYYGAIVRADLSNIGGYVAYYNDGSRDAGIPVFTAPSVKHFLIKCTRDFVNNSVTPSPAVLTPGRVYMAQRTGKVAAFGATGAGYSQDGGITILDPTDSPAIAGCRMFNVIANGSVTGGTFP